MMPTFFDLNEEEQIEGFVHEMFGRALFGLSSNDYLAQDVQNPRIFVRLIRMLSNPIQVNNLAYEHWDKEASNSEWWQRKKRGE